MSTLQLLTENNQFATLCFRVIVGLIGLVIVFSLYNIFQDSSTFDISTVVGLLAGIFISILFIGYAIGGSSLVERIFPRFIQRNK